MWRIGVLGACLAAGVLTGCTGDSAGSDDSGAASTRPAAADGGSAGGASGGAARGAAPRLGSCLPLAVVRAEVTEIDRVVDAPLDDPNATLTCAYKSLDDVAPVRFYYVIGSYPSTSAARATFDGLRQVVDDCGQKQCQLAPRNDGPSVSWRATGTAYEHVRLSAKTAEDVVAGQPGARTAWYDMAIRNGRYVCFMPTLTSEAVTDDVPRLQAVGEREFRLLRQVCGT